MLYPELISTIGFYAQQEQVDASFAVATTNFIRSAELRCYRDLDLSASTGENTSLQTTAFSKVLDLTGMTGQVVTGGTPVAYPFPVVVQGVSAKVGNRWIPLQVCSLDWLEMIWPDDTQFAPPAVGLAFYNVLDDETIQLAPTPDRVYPLRITGQWRPAGITANNPRAWLWDNIPDLAFAAVMVEILGYQRDFGAQAEDPKAALSWEARYRDCLHSAKMEEYLKRGQGPDFQPVAPAPLAHPAPPAAG